MRPGYPTGSMNALAAHNVVDAHGVTDLGFRCYPAGLSRPAHQEARCRSGLHSASRIHRHAAQQTQVPRDVVRVCVLHCDGDRRRTLPLLVDVVEEIVGDPANTAAAIEEKYSALVVFVVGFIAQFQFLTMSKSCDNFRNPLRMVLVHMA